MNFYRGDTSKSVKKTDTANKKEYIFSKTGLYVSIGALLVSIF